MDHSEPRRRRNSSASPPNPGRWDCRFQSDGLPRGTPRAPASGSPLSSNSKGSVSGSRSARNNDQIPSHHHSVSDGALPYFGSPSDTFQLPRWTPPAQMLNLGLRQDNLEFPHHSERHVNVAPPLSELSKWASSSKQPVFFPPRGFPGRRPKSKLVYPIFQNPVSDCDAGGTAEGSSRETMLPGYGSWTSPESALSPDVRFLKAVTDLQKLEAYPEPGASSRREGFRWSNASSYDAGFEGDGVVDITESLWSSNPRSPARNIKCGLCKRLLWQKSPWSSYRIVRNGDPPISGVLSCGHVFHADCLEETAAPKGQAQDPPCPLCAKETGATGDPAAFLEPLGTAVAAALGSSARSIGDFSPDAGAISGPSRRFDLRRYRSLPHALRHGGGGSVIKDRFRKGFSFKGKHGKNAQ